MSKKDDLSEFPKFELDVEEHFKDVIGEAKVFPKNVTQIMNLCNQNAQGTRPKVVGQLSELILKCPDKTFAGWKEWYLENHPDAIEDAAVKVCDMVEKLKVAIKLIDKKMVREWVEDLVVTKTAEGLVTQEVVLKYVAEMLGKDWRRATPKEESSNVDGFIGELPVQIKADSYFSKKPTVREVIPVEIIYYKKTAKFLCVYTRLLEEV